MACRLKANPPNCIINKYNTSIAVVLVSSMCGQKTFVYPNPAKNRIYISNATTGNPNAICNTIGLQVKTGIVNGNYELVVITA